MMLAGVGGTMRMVGWVPVTARRAERLVAVRVTNAELVQVPAMLAGAESLDEQVHRDPIGILSEGRQTDGVTVGVDQRDIERRCRRRHWRSQPGGHRRRTLGGRCRSAVLGGCVE